MCGIAGYFGTKEIPPALIQEALQLLQRRGPDDSEAAHLKSKSGKNVYLLHRRLSIIDLDERSRQPMTRGESTLCYNGELYNYIELKQELQQQGCSFSTEGDTEVLLNLLRTDGWQGLDRAEGMWAFAYFDSNKDELILCRDRFGEKPLYVLRDASGVYFASEIRALAVLCGKKFRPNYDHLYRYLVNGYKALYKNDTGFYHDVEALEPRAVHVFQSGGQEKRHIYWQPKFSPNDQMSYQEAVSGAYDRLHRSVELRLRADVPLAFCMSGGVDSNALIALASKELNFDVHGFTIVNSDERYDEIEIVDNVVQELGLKHTCVDISHDNFISNLSELIRYHSSPVITITYYAQWTLLQKVAEHGYKISLSGTGADELFSGYYDHHNFYLAMMQEDSERFSSALSEWQQYIKPIVRNPHLQDPEVFIKDPNFRDHIFLDADVFASYLKADWHESFSEESFCQDLLRNRMLNEMFHEAVAPILHEDDLNAMYYSIENRSPFLDRELFEFCYTIPTRHLVQEGFAKAVLRDAMQGVVPASVLESKRKVGFNAPILEYLDVNDPLVREYLLDDSPIFDHVKKGMIEDLVNEDFLPNSRSKFLFYFLNSKIFLEECV